MKNYFFLFSLLLSGCAGQTVTTKADYIGNDLVEIVASGGDKVESDAIRAGLYKKAYEACREKNSGFKMVEDLRMIPHYVTTGWLYKQTHTEETYRLVIKCEGEVDKELERKYSAPASK